MSLESKKDSSGDGTPRWTIIVGGLASLATIFSVIFGVYAYARPSPSSGPSTPAVSSTSSAPNVPSTQPTSSVPRLHTSYTGTYTHTDNTDAADTPFTLFSLLEDDNGNFNASGDDGECQATYQGFIHQDGSVAFTMTEASTSTCGVIFAFSGKLFSDGHLEGSWRGQGAFAQFGGLWSMQ